MLQTTRSAVICLSPDRRILSWNRGAERVFGYSAEEVLGEDYFDRFLPEDVQPDIGDAVSRILAGEELSNYENRVIVRDGSERTLVWNSTRLVGEDGKLLGLAAIGQDITELKRAQTLQSGENRALKRLLGGAALPEVLSELGGTLEAVCPEVHCALLLKDADGRRLHCMAAPSLPSEMVRHLDCLTIGERAAFCCVAAETGRRIVIPDISAAAPPSPHWQTARLHGYAGCWAEPIMAGSGEVLGVISAYLVRSRQPSQYELDSVERTGRLAGLAADHQRATEERLRESETRLQDAEVALRELQDELRKRFSFEEIIAVSPAMLRVMQLAAQVAPTEATILITGETGTGKEILARAIHSNSQRGKGPFIAVNCGAIPETLIESELFGHERGAFTGADRRKPGQVERARGGTLFLDEVGELIPATQVKLLRMLQERTFERLGGTETIAADVRIIAATNRNLAAEMEKGNFRDDLYYRLNVFHIHIPPLRERKEAIPLLAEGILKRIAEQLGRPEIALSKLALQALQDYEWKGNVRELQNALERAAILSEGSLIGPEHLPIIQDASGSRVRPVGEGEFLVRLDDGFSLQRLESELAKRALRLAKGNKSKAARLLGVSRGSFRWRLQRIGEEK